MPIHIAHQRHLLSMKRRHLHLPFGSQRFLAILEGLEGGFAIGASVIVGLSFAHLNRHVLLMSAAISIIVNGFNSAAVKYSSEHYEDELDGREKRSAWHYYFIPAAIEFLAYFAISFITVIPLLLVDNQLIAIVVCCFITLTTLFCAGYWRGYLLQLHPIRDGLETMILGACIIIVGAVTGYLLYLPVS